MDPPPPLPPTARRSRSAGLRAFLRRHPIVLLACLTPGIPEYLSGSSAVSAIVLNPFLFVFQLAANVGLYTTGALLIREAMVRGRKGWPSLALLGGAYALLEEGVALATFFNPASSVVGSLGAYGHFLGVNWVWATALEMFHAVYSIALPLLLLSLALPEIRGRPLVGTRGLIATIVLLGADVGALTYVTRVVAGFTIPLPILLASLVTIAIVVVVAWRLPPDAGPSPGAAAARSPRTLIALGLVLFPVTILAEGLFQYAGAPAAVAVAGLAAFFLSWGWLVLPDLSRVRHPRRLLTLAVGLIAPVAVFGVLASIHFPLLLVVDLGIFLILRSLWRKYPAADEGAASAPTLAPRVN